MSTLEELLNDLRTESSELDRIVCDLSPEGWAALTPAVGWTIAHQISHLAYTDDWAYTAVTDPEEFRRRLEAASNDHVDVEAANGVREHPRTLLARWRHGRDRFLLAACNTDPEARMPWFGPPMKLASMVTARIMAPRRAHHGIRLHPQQSARPGCAGTRGTPRPERRRMGLGSCGVFRLRSWSRARFLPTRHSTSTSQRRGHHGQGRNCAAVADDRSSLRGPIRTRSITGQA